MTEMVMIEVGKLQESKSNPRTTFDKTGLNELAQSIKEKGVLLPLIVRFTASTNGSVGLHEIVSGARRFKAAKLAGLKEVPCITRVLTDEEAMEIQLIENLQREDVHPVFEAEGYKRLRDQGYSIEQIATKVSKSAGYVQQRLQYVHLIEPARKMFLAGNVGLMAAALVARLQPDQQKECLPLLKRGDSPAELKLWIERQFFLRLSEAPFDTKDAKLVPEAGSCTDCPKRTGFNKLLFADIKNADTCTDPDCYENKARAFIKIQIGTHPDAILLSVGYYGYNGKTKGLHPDKWKAVAKACDHSKEGIIVQLGGDGYGHNDEYMLGQSVLVCTDPGKCKTHKESNGSSRGTGRKLTPSEKTKRIKERRAWLITEAAFVAAVANLREKPTLVTDDYIRNTVTEIIDHYQFKYRAAPLALAFGVPGEGKTPSKKAADCAKKLSTVMEKASRNDLIAFLAIYSVTPSDYGQHAQSPDVLALAKHAGVKLAEIEKRIEAPKQKAAKPEAKKKSAAK